MPPRKLPSPSIFDTGRPATGPGSQRLEPDYAEAFTTWKTTPTPQTRSALLTQVMPVVDSAVHSYARATAGPNIRNRARLMAAKAFDTYSPDKGTLRTHLLSQLQGLRRVVGQDQNILRVPEQLLLDRNFLHQTTQTLADETGRDLDAVSDIELADRTGLSLKRIRYIRQVKPAVSQGQLGTDDEGDMIDPSVQIPGAQDASSAWEDFVYQDLDPTNRAILDMSRGRYGRRLLTTEQIAAKLGISASAVSQRKQKIQAMLDEQHSAGLF